MLITTLLVTGTVAYAGVKTLVSHHQTGPKPLQKGQTGITNPTVNKTVRKERTATDNREAQVVENVAPRTVIPLADRRQRAAAGTALLLSMAGVIWAPLTLASAPLTIYSSLSVFEAAGQSLYSDGKIRPSVINSILLVSTLVTEHYLPAAAISWLHHSFKQIGQRIQAAGEQFSNELDVEYGELLRQAFGASPQMVWIVRTGGEEGDDVEVQIPFRELKTGDTLVSNRGEIVPVNGVVNAGEATLNLLLVTGTSTPVTVGEGDQVYKGAFVTEGRLWIKVDPLQ